MQDKQYCDNMKAGFENDLDLAIRQVKDDEGEDVVSLHDVFAHWLTHPDFHQIANWELDPALCLEMGLHVGATLYEALYVAAYQEGCREQFAELREENADG
jgi:hypothetical protein